jgi:formylglycine-generating enzyme required for sulfatase activity
LNEYKNPERIQAGGTGSRVLRGGSWRYDPDFARAQARNDDGPGSRSFSFGFRVVAVLSPMKN